MLQMSYKCGREYGFVKEGEEPCATELHKMSLTELKVLPTNNSITFRNKSLIARSFRTDTPLYQGNQAHVDVLNFMFQKMLL